MQLMASPEKCLRDKWVRGLSNESLFGARLLRLFGALGSVPLPFQGRFEYVLLRTYSAYEGSCMMPPLNTRLGVRAPDFAAPPVGCTGALKHFRAP